MSEKSSSARVERATCCLGGSRSIHLSYEDINLREDKTYTLLFFGGRCKIEAQFQDFLALYQTDPLTHQVAEGHLRFLGLSLVEFQMAA